jgi:hypothetical protein
LCNMIIHWEHYGTLLVSGYTSLGLFHISAVCSWWWLHRCPWMPALTWFHLDRFCAMNVGILTIWLPSITTQLPRSTKATWTQVQVHRKTGSTFSDYVQITIDVVGTMKACCFPKDSYIMLGART